MNKGTVYSDERLVGLAKSGNAAAYNALLERSYHKVRHIIGYYINEPASINDIAQEVLIKVFRNLDYFKVESQFSTWLYRIALNTIKNHLRTSSMRTNSEEQFANEYYFSFSESPEYELIDSELGQRVALAVSRLSEDLRQCYGMHIFEGHTYEDIAREMNCPIGTVRSRIHRARKLMIGFVGHGG